jgi:outer membrane receptor protein involved in Fe transport
VGLPGSKENKAMNRRLNTVLGTLFVVTLALFAGPAGAQAMGLAAVTGFVKLDTGEAIPGITVTAEPKGDLGNSVVAYTEVDGAFRINDLKPAEYVVRAELDGFAPASVEVKPGSGQVVRVAFKLVPSTFSETMTVEAAALPVGEAAVLEIRRQAPVVSDMISAEEIRRTPDSNAAGVVERLTGVSVVGEKYVFVRGLGERYTGTTINGATVPTTETEKRVVPLDLFPAKLLESVNVLKSNTPDMPGDFGSGVVEMSTTAFPTSASFSVSLGATHYDQSTGSPFRRYAGGLSRQGSGGQPLPSSVPSSALFRSSILNPEGFTAAELQDIGRGLVGQWTGDAPKSANPKTDFSITYGNTFGALGVVLSATSAHGYETVDEIQRFYALDTGGQLVARNDFNLVTDREKATSGLVANLSLRLSGTSQIYLNSVLTRDAGAETRFQEGLNTNAGGDVQDYRVRYQIEEVMSTRLGGKHNLSGPATGSLLEWNVAYSEASNDSDLRENLYQEASPGVFALFVGAPEAGRMDYFGLQDEIEQGGVAYSVFYSGRDNHYGSLKFGADYSQRTRDFAARRLRFTTRNPNQFDLTKRPEEIFTEANIRPDGFEIREFTGVNDAYDAEHTVSAGYAMVDSTMGKWRFIGGARFEDSDQSVFTYNPFDTSAVIESSDVNTDVLPSLNVVYQYSPSANLRFGYSRSLNRPEFRELSPFTFVEVTGGRSVAGNPNLTQATLDGFDVRWELFPGPGQVIALSTFYKKIDKPIERIIQPTTDLRTSFVNADSATLMGAEIEFRRSLEFISPALERWAINVNYSWIDSDVEVGEQELSVVTNTERPLEGQSDQLANVAVQYVQPNWGTMVRLLGSYVGARITDIGAFGLPDIYEDAYTSVDMVVSQQLRFARGLSVKLTGSNLLDESRTFTQGGELQRSIDVGRSFGLSLAYSPF